MWFYTLVVLWNTFSWHYNRTIKIYNRCIPKAQNNNLQGSGLKSRKCVHWDCWEGKHWRDTIKFWWEFHCSVHTCGSRCGLWLVLAAILTVILATFNLLYYYKLLGSHTSMTGHLMSLITFVSRSLTHPTCWWAFPVTCAVNHGPLCISSWRKPAPRHLRTSHLPLSPGSHADRARKWMLEWRQKRNLKGGNSGEMCKSLMCWVLRNDSRYSHCPPENEGILSQMSRQAERPSRSGQV